VIGDPGARENSMFPTGLLQPRAQKNVISNLRVKKLSRNLRQHRR
jgi:hypothetical protein